MLSRAVQLRLSAPVSFECSFWIEDDGWKASCERLSLVASGVTFEQAKNEIRLLIKAQIEQVMEEWTLSRRDQKRSDGVRVLPFPTKKQIL